MFQEKVGIEKRQVSRIMNPLDEEGEEYEAECSGEEYEKERASELKPLSKMPRSKASYNTHTDGRTSELANEYCLSPVKNEGTRMTTQQMTLTKM